MAIVKTTAIVGEVVECDICGKRSQVEEKIFKTPQGFSNVMLDKFMNVCDDCKKQLVLAEKRLRQQLYKVEKP